jgi:hypothetical protein
MGTQAYRNKGIRYIISADVGNVIALIVEPPKTGIILYIWGYALIMACSVSVMCLFSGIFARTHALQNTSARLPQPQLCFGP